MGELCKSTIEMLQYLLCSIIVICRLRFVKTKSLDLWDPIPRGQKFHVGNNWEK